MDRITSYIVIHSVSANPPEVQISYYEWLIENLTRQRAVQRTRLASLSDSIAAYDKDSVIILTSPEGGSSVAPGLENINGNYDAMIHEKLATQATIASYNRSISYYESVIEGFRKAEGSSDPKDVEMVRNYLEVLNAKVTELASDVSATVNEYYEKVSFSNQIRIMIPAVFDTVPSSLIIKVVAVVEALLFLIYASVAVVLGIREANPKKPKQHSEEREEPVALTSEA